MSKQRKSEKDKQTGFSKLHYDLGSKYLTDYDSISNTSGVIYDTENKSYSQYSYAHDMPKVSDFLEVKYKPSPYLREMMKKERKTDSQTLLFCSLAREINANRSEKDFAHFYIVVESEGKMPFYVMEVSMDTNKVINYKHVATINTKDEYLAFFK